MFRATTTFHALGRTITEGDELADTDPILEGRGRLFERVGPAPVERATAAPGEKRNTSKPGK